MKRINRFIWWVETSSYTGVVRSGFEADFTTALDNAGYPFEYEPVRLPYKECKTRNYTPDLVLPKAAGGLMHLELKGRFTTPDRTKMLNVKRAYPELDIRMVFQYASRPIYKGSKTTYSAWCDKHGFPWAETRGGKQLILPQEWLDEVKNGD